MSKQIIRSQAAPQPVGPYSQAVAASEFIFMAGQIPVDPESGKLIQGDITAQTKRVLENIKAVLSAGDASLSDVVKTTVFMVDLSEFASMNAVYAEYFSSQPPARSTIQVAALPMGARVEIECLAVKPKK